MKLKLKLLVVLGVVLSLAGITTIAYAATSLLTVHNSINITVPTPTPTGGGGGGNSGSVTIQDSLGDPLGNGSTITWTPVNANSSGDATPSYNFYANNTTASPVTINVALSNASNPGLALGSFTPVIVSPGTNEVVTVPIIVSGVSTGDYTFDLDFSD